MSLKIEKVKYFGNETNSKEWNAKVLYNRNGQLHHAMIFICFFSNEIYINKKIQAPECKVYQGLLSALRKSNYFGI